MYFSGELKGQLHSLRLKSLGNSGSSTKRYILPS